MTTAAFYYDQLGIIYHLPVYRISQIYDEEVCSYFYSAFKANADEDTMKVF